MEAASESCSSGSRAFGDGYRCDSSVEDPTDRLVAAHESAIPSVVPPPEVQPIVDSSVSPLWDPVVPEDADARIARAMTELSMHEREEVYNDRHGVADAIVETPEMIDEAIGRMKLELSKMSTEAEAYHQALAQDSSYVHNYKSLLCFLRAERFDVVRAAARLKNFYSFKLEGFGVEKLTKDIYQEDLTEQEREGMYDSMTHLLPFRDRGGRCVVVKVVSLPLPSTPVQELIRRGLYGSCSHSRDEDNQKNGLSSVVYFVGDDCNPEKFSEMIKQNHHWARLTESIPLRQSVIHLCYSSASFRLNTSSFRMSVDSCTGLRTLEHFGDHKALRFALLTHGIPNLGFPVTEDGTILRHLCREFWTKRRLLEDNLQRENSQPSPSSAANPYRTQNPNENDVLLGRGNALTLYVGNIRLRKLVAEKLSDYDSAHYAEKQHVSQDIVQIIRERGGRFLKKHDSFWMEVDGEIARSRVSRAFQSIMRESKRSHTS